MGSSQDDRPTQVDMCVLLPVYNDWACFPRLLAEIDRALIDSRRTAIVVVMNDGGASSPADADFFTRKYERISEFRVVELVRNLGNQNALAVGLSFVRDEVPCETVVVMDSDGQDIPGDLAKLLAAHDGHPSSLIVAERSGRSEGLVFKQCYRLYRAMFRVLVGQHMTFGNYSVIPRRHLPRLCAMAELPVNLAATFMKSRLPIERVPCFRGARYDGRTSQNIVSLIIHGVNGILVFSEIALVRVTLLSAALILCGLVGIAAVTAIRLFTNYAVAGWATYVIGILALLIGQAVLFALLATLARGRNPISLIVEPERYRFAISSVTSIDCARAHR